MPDIVWHVSAGSEEFRLGATDLTVRNQEANQFNANAATLLGQCSRPGRVERVMIEPERLRHVLARRGQARQVEVDLSIFRCRFSNR